MSQPQNNITTLMIQDPNGQPQMIKVVGSAKFPFQIAAPNLPGTAGGTTLKTVIKTNNQSTEQGSTVIHTNKIANRQIFTLPAKSNLNVQGICTPLVVPVSSVQLKSPVRSQNDQLPSTAIITSRTQSATISSPLTIRSQAGSAVVAASSTSYPSLQQPLKVGNVISTTSIMPAQIKQMVTNRPQTFALKPQTLQIQKQPEGVLTLQKPDTNMFQQVQIVMNNQQHPKPHQQQSQQPTQVQLQTPQQKSQVHQRHPYHSTQSLGVTPPKSLMNTSILDHSGSRKRHDFHFDYNIESKRRKTEKGGKGLRHFSMKVCEKVKAKGTTSYNEVADELVSEFTDANRSSSPTDAVNYDQKNIRRRVYDALNVLMAMNIISKEKKEIRWLGLPTNSAQECHKLEQDRKKSLQRIKLKSQQLQDLILQQIAFKNLVERNRKMERENGAPSSNSAIQLPFIIVNTNKKTVIDCSISNDKTEYLFNFDNTFEIHDDIEVLKRMGMALGLEKGACTPEDLVKAKCLLPKALEGYVAELAEGSTESTGSKLNEDGSQQRSLNLGDEYSVFVEELNMNEEKMEDENAVAVSGIQQRSRHSSIASFNNDIRTDSVSPSSFGDYDAFEESDIEIN